MPPGRGAMVSPPTPQSLYAAVRRFVARRSPPTHGATPRPQVQEELGIAPRDWAAPLP